MKVSEQEVAEALDRVMEKLFYIDIDPDGPDYKEGNVMFGSGCDKKAVARELAAALNKE